MSHGTEKKAKLPFYPTKTALVENIGMRNRIISSLDIQGSHTPINGDIRYERPELIGVQIKETNIKHGSNFMQEEH
jgi:hypothetical protein